MTKETKFEWGIVYIFNRVYGYIFNYFSSLYFEPYIKDAKENPASAEYERSTIEPNEAVLKALKNHKGTQWELDNNKRYFD